MALPPPDPQLRKILGWVFILMGIPLAIYIASRIHEKSDSSSWPSVAAQVITSELYKRSGRGGVDWCLKINYRYSVAGKRFSSRRMSTSRIGNAPCTSDRSEAMDRLTIFKPGSTFTAYYKPSSPADSIVYVGQLDVLDYFFPAISLLLLISGVLLVKDEKKGLNEK